jgi:cbb3-type cytochrome oxidase maturation protein
MKVLMICIGFSLFIALGFLVLFLWAVRNGQFEDQVTPSIRMLFDNQSDKNRSTTDANVKVPNSKLHEGAAD